MRNAVRTDVREIDGAESLEALIASVGEVVRGKRETIRLSVAALLAGGHLLFEDVPGVGKTTLARALASALGLEFRRIQFTSDLLPSDVLGASIYDPRTQQFETRPGPIMTNVVLADEINRAPPRTQSGLLEAMQEGRITIDDRTLDLPDPFLVIATQNPLEQHGTYPLPESQLDRFMMRLSVGYPSVEDERALLLADAPGEAIARRVLDPMRVTLLRERVGRVRVDPALIEYILAIAVATRRDPRLRTGVSTRATLVMQRAARAYAMVDGRDFLVPDDVRRLVVPCLAHRVVPATGGGSDGYARATEILQEIADAVPVPI